MTTPTDSPQVRLLVLCAGDPDSERAFSGSARNLIQALERLGCVHHKANVLGTTDSFRRGPLWLRALRRADRFGIEEHYQWSSIAFARNSARAEAIARVHPGFNACLMYGTTFHPALDVPRYCYFDATAAQVYAARAWEFARFSERRARRIVRYQQGVFNACSTIFPRTKWAARSVRDDYGIPESRIAPAGAGPNYFADPPPHGPYDTRTLLFVGSEFERKGGPLVVEAFREVRRSLPDARLLIVGCEPPLREPGVEVVGRISKDVPGGLERLLDCYAQASLFCIMSEFEPFGIVVLEAQNSRVPCLVPARFAFPETVQENVSGRLVPDYRKDVLARMMIELLGNPHLLEKMGAAGHDFVRSEWTWDAAARRIRDRIAADLRAGVSR